MNYNKYWDGVRRVVRDVLEETGPRKIWEPEWAHEAELDDQAINAVFNHEWLIDTRYHTDILQHTRNEYAIDDLLLDLSEIVQPGKASTQIAEGIRQQALWAFLADVREELEDVLK